MEVLVLYTHNHNHNDINQMAHIHNILKYSQIQNTGGPRHCSGTNAFINFLTSVLQHEERDTILTILTILSDPTNTLCILWCLRSLLVEIWKTQLHLQNPTLNFQLNGSNSTFACMVQCQLSTDVFFQNPQILSPSLLGMTSSTLQPHFLSGVYYDNGDCHILCARA